MIIHTAQQEQQNQCNSSREQERDKMLVCSVPAVYGHAFPPPAGVASLEILPLRRGIGFLCPFFLRDFAHKTDLDKEQIGNQCARCPRVPGNMLNGCMNK
jgi:hypothetical protein